MLVVHRSKVVSICWFLDELLMIIRYFAPVAEAAGVDGWGRDRIGMLDILLISLLPGWSELELAHVEAVDHLLGGKVLHVPLVERNNWVIGVSY